MTIFFDLYGTLIHIETERYSQEAARVYSTFLAERDIHISEEIIFEDLILKIKCCDFNPPPSGEETDHFPIFKNFFRTRGYDLADHDIHALGYQHRVSGRSRIKISRDLRETLRVLRKKHRLAILSNAQYIYTRPEIRMFGLDHEVEMIFLSSELGIRKPDRRIFEHALKELGGEPTAAVYVGDNPGDDLPGPSALGWKIVWIKVLRLHSIVLFRRF